MKISNFEADEIQSIQLERGGGKNYPLHDDQHIRISGHFRDSDSMLKADEAYVFGSLFLCIFKEKVILKFQLKIYNFLLVSYQASILHWHPPI